MPSDVRSARRAVVAGAGPGGSVTALLLAACGWQVSLLERVAAPTAVGAGILLQPNGLAVLAALGLHEPIHAPSPRDPRCRDPEPPRPGAAADHGPGPRRRTRPPARRPAQSPRDRPRRCRHRRTRHHRAPGRGGRACDAGRARSPTAPMPASRSSTPISSSPPTASGRGSGRPRASPPPCTTPGTRTCVPSSRTTARARRRRNRPSTGPRSACSAARRSATAPSISSPTPDRSGCGARSSAATQPACATRGPRCCRSPRRSSRASVRSTTCCSTRCNASTPPRSIRGGSRCSGDAAHAMAPNLGQGANSALVDAAVLAIELSTAPTSARPSPPTTPAAVPQSAPCSATPTDSPERERVAQRPGAGMCATR